MKQYSIQFPPQNSEQLSQDEAFFYLKTQEGTEKLRFHDYGQIYQRAGLYEQLFYERLKCDSPRKITENLKLAMDANEERFTELKALDLGAGNGIVGEELRKIGLARLVGVDIIPEAQVAAERDRPGLYDAYLVKDFTCLTEAEVAEIKVWELNALITVAALGFGDIPPLAFVQAFNLVGADGWIAFNIRDRFLYESESSDFAQLIRKLIFSDYLKINHLERYRHRLSIEGKPLYYFSVVGRKQQDIPLALLQA